MQTSNLNLKLRSKSFIFSLAFAISTGAFVMGYALVGTALLQEDIQQYNKIPKQHMDYELSMIVTLLPFGALIGSLICGKSVQIMGEKNILLIVDAMMAIALLMQAFSLDLYVMYITRIIFGLFCGISSAIIPTYLTSISPLSMTGIVGSFNQLLITIGISVAYAMNFFLESDMLTKDVRIKIFILVSLPFCLIRILTLLFIYPYDTVEKHYQRKEVTQVQQIMNRFYVDASYEQFCRVKNLSESQSMDTDKKQHSSQQIIRPTYSAQKGRKRILLLAIVIAISNQMCGINAIFFYAKQLFTNLTGGDQEMVQIDLFGLGIFQVIITFASSLFLDRFGRRFLMLVGETIVVGSLFGAFICTDVLDMAPSVVVFFIFLHLFGFSISLGPIGCLYASEIMQDISLVIALMWFLTLVVAMCSDMLIKSLGIGETFLIFGLISLSCLVYFWKQMIESKGLNRAQLQQKFASDARCKVRISLHQEFQQMQQIAQNEA